MTSSTQSPHGALRSATRPGYFADPYVVRAPNGSYAAYGTQPDGGSVDHVFEVLVSEDLRNWRSGGPALERLAPEVGDQYWAPEVCWRDGAWWMYYSVGRGIEGHHIRVARSEKLTGPFTDLGVNLTPLESFAIDPHPFQDTDGHWYLFFARDVLDSERPGTHLAVGRMDDPTTLTGVREALTPNADWQIYERDREMYGGVYDWHTLEGPSVVYRGGQYWMTFSGGGRQRPHRSGHGLTPRKPPLRFSQRGRPSSAQGTTPWWSARTEGT
jgi:beta-xylosidase